MNESNFKMLNKLLNHSIVPSTHNEGYENFYIWKISVGPLQHVCILLILELPLPPPKLEYRSIIFSHKKNADLNEFFFYLIPKFLTGPAML